MSSTKEIIEYNAEYFEPLRVVDMGDTVDAHWGFDGIFKLTETDIEALRKGKALYDYGDEYAHLIYMEVDNG